MQAQNITLTFSNVAVNYSANAFRRYIDDVGR